MVRPKLFFWLSILFLGLLSANSSISSEQSDSGELFVRFTDYLDPYATDVILNNAPTRVTSYGNISVAVQSYSPFAMSIQSLRLNTTNQVGQRRAFQAFPNASLTLSEALAVTFQDTMGSFTPIFVTYTLELGVRISSLTNEKLVTPRTKPFPHEGVVISLPINLPAQYLSKTNPNPYYATRQPITVNSFSWIPSGWIFLFIAIIGTRKPRNGKMSGTSKLSPPKFF